MDRITRKDLKTDRFAQEVGHTFEFISTHRTEVIRYGGLGLLAILIAGGIFYYMRYQAGIREEALAQAFRMDEATIAPNIRPGVMSFPSEAEKSKARDKAFLDIAVKYQGTIEGAIARNY